MKKRLLLVLPVVLLLGGPGPVPAAEGDHVRRERLELQQRLLEATEYLLEELEAHAHE